MRKSNWNQGYFHCKFNYPLPYCTTSENLFPHVLGVLLQPLFNSAPEGCSKDSEESAIL